MMIQSKLMFNRKMIVVYCGVANQTLVSNIFLVSMSQITTFLKGIDYTLIEAH